MLRLGAIVTLSSAAVASTALAQQATSVEATVKAYGARVGVRNESPDFQGLSLDVRTVTRLPTRIDTRLRTRLERYGDPTQALQAYRVRQDDGSRDGSRTGANLPALPSGTREIGTTTPVIGATAGSTVPAIAEPPR